MTNDTNRPVAFRYWDSPRERFVRIALCDGQEHESYEGGLTDEGWYRRDECFWREGDTVFRRIETQSRDCDGRLDSSVVLSCHIDRLESETNSYGEQIPDWQVEGGGRRDHTAEAAGY